MGRNQRFEIAQKHTDLVEQTYSYEIKKCIKDTRVYGIDFTRLKTADRGATFELEQSYTQESVLRHSGDGKLAVLNFASYRHPGGGFINGSLAQEEALCHASFLYNVLREFPDYYEWNINNYNKGLYMNRALYSPDVYFFKESEEEYIKADVITCAAPNRSMLVKDGRFTEKENEVALKDRIRFIRDICDEEDVETLIAGAFGCGVFAQKPEMVAHYFREYFSDTKVKAVIFAVPPDRNYVAFEREFK